jgi:hypothetical protein
VFGQAFFQAGHFQFAGGIVEGVIADKEKGTFINSFCSPIPGGSATGEPSRRAIFCAYPLDPFFTNL